MLTRRASNRLLNTSQTGGTTKTYTIDATGNTTSDGKNTYTYDGRSRLLQAAGPGFTTEYYRINGLGQRTAKVTGTAPDMAGDVNQDGQITSSDATQLSQLITAGTATVSIYNDCNKDGSVNASDVTCINTKITDIAANPSKYIQTGTYFAYDEAGHLLGEYTQAGIAVQETVWLGDIPVATLTSTGIYYIYPDHLNTPRAIVDSTNKTVWRWKDPAFGNGQPDQDPDKDGKVFVYNLRFPGQYYDQSTGLHYNWFRDYDPVTGRYVESDPIGLAGGLNTYAYVGGNPVNMIDPLGLYQMCQRDLQLPLPYAKHCFIKFGDGSTSSYDPKGVNPDPDPDQSGTMCSEPKDPDKDDCIKKAMQQCEGKNYNFTKFNCCHCAEQAMKECGTALPTSDWPNWPFNPGPQFGELGYTRLPKYNKDLGK